MSGDKAGRIPELDGIRGIAILLVLLWHLFVLPMQEDFAPHNFAYRVFQVGGLFWSGVDLFFVLSGFLIGGILLDQQAARNLFSVFYLRRAFRILPLYYALLLSYWLARCLAPTLLAAPKFEELFGQPLNFWGYLFFGQNLWMAAYNQVGMGYLNVTWSLAVEEQFYLLLPALIRFVRTHWLPWVLFAGIASAPLLRTQLYFAGPQHGVGIYVLLFCRADALLIGVACALLIRRAGWWQWLQQQVRRLYVLFGFLLAGAAGLSLSGQSIGSFHISIWGYTWMALLYAVFLLIAISEKRGLISFLVRLKPLRELGCIAYSVYLFHDVLARAVFALAFDGRSPLRSTGGAWGWKLLALFLTILLAKFSWHYFEKPLIQRGHKYQYTRNAEPVQPAARELQAT